MKVLNYKRNVLLLVLLFVLFNQLPAQTETVAQIDKYVKTISSFTKGTKQRIFADIASDGKRVNWKEFATEKLLNNADRGDNLNESAVIWTKDGKITAATFTFQSPSRDWAQFATYFYRANGMLAKVESNLNTFYGNITAKRSYYFNSKGKLLKKDVKYFDLKSQKAINPKTREFIDEEVKFFKDTNKLPFIKLLKKKTIRSRK